MSPTLFPVLALAPLLVVAALVLRGRSRKKADRVAEAQSRFLPKNPAREEAKRLLEEALDVAESKAALAEGGPLLSHEEVKRSCGLSYEETLAAMQRKQSHPEHCCFYPACSEVPGAGSLYCPFHGEKLKREALQWAVEWVERAGVGEPSGPEDGNRVPFSIYFVGDRVSEAPHEESERLGRRVS